MEQQNKCMIFTWQDEYFFTYFNILRLKVGWWEMKENHNIRNNFAKIFL